MLQIATILTVTKIIEDPAIMVAASIEIPIKCTRKISPTANNTAASRKKYAYRRAIITLPYSGSLFELFFPYGPLT